MILLVVTRYNNTQVCCREHVVVMLIHYQNYVTIKYFGEHVYLLRRLYQFFFVSSTSQRHTAQLHQKWQTTLCYNLLALYLRVMLVWACWSRSSVQQRPFEMLLAVVVPSCCWSGNSSNCPENHNVLFLLYILLLVDPMLSPTCTYSKAAFAVVGLLKLY